jgi:uncharacterized protein (DUF4415 family)
MPKLKPGTVRPTDDEDKEIVRQAREDGTLHSDQELAEFKPFEASDLPVSFKQTIRRRGRPRKSNPKVQVSIRYSREVVEYFRATGPGWQTRMDEALKEWIAGHR